MPTLITLSNEVLEPPKESILFNYYRPRFADEYNTKHTVRAVYREVLKLIKDDKNRFELYTITEDEARGYLETSAILVYEIVKSGIKL